MAAPQLPSPPDTPEPDRLHQAGIVVFVLACGGPAMVMDGFWNFGGALHVSLQNALLIATVGGLAGGLLVCPRPALAGLLGGLVAGPPGLLAVYYYGLHREHLWTLEIGIVQFIGSLPGYGVGLALKRLLGGAKSPPTTC